MYHIDDNQQQRVNPINFESCFQSNNINIYNMQQEQKASQELQQLLEEFNKLDKKKQGNIKLQQAVRLLRQKTQINVFKDDLYDRIIFNNDKFVTFDEFLALLYQAELDAGIHNHLINYKMVEFLKLLEDYRKKCEQASMYAQADKSYQKTNEIKDKQMRRHKQKMMMQQKSRVLSVTQIQQNKLLEFNTAWNQYMQNYEDAALSSLQKLKAKHLREMQVQQQRIRSYYQNYLKPSKKVIDLKTKQKLLVKQKQYMQAEKLKKLAQKIQEKQREQKNQEIAQRIRKRKETLQKHQEASLMAHLKRLQKDRNSQLKKRQADSQKMLIKLKNIQNDIVQKQSHQIKETLQNLRQTMCLTSGQLFRSKSRRIRSTDKLDGMSRSRLKISSNEVTPKKQNLRSSMKKTGFKIRINSFHKAPMDSSMYNP